MKKAFQSFRKHHPFPTSRDLMWPTLTAIKQLGGSGTNEEIFDKIVRIERISEEVQSVPLNDRKTLLQDQASWARSHLKWIGALENSRTGVWAITAIGEKLKQSEIPGMVDEAKRNTTKINRQHNKKQLKKMKFRGMEQNMPGKNTSLKLSKP